MKTITSTEAKGVLAAALVVREHEDLVFISQNGMVQRTGVRGINRYGRASQGVKVMNLREGDEVSAVALVVETEDAAVDVELPDIEATDGAPEASVDGDGIVAIEPDAIADDGADEDTEA